ncbi:LysE family transporter [Catenulispora sp. NF23]|uniref:LysE family transporter n=1 Tax=Catenulispora pinistramenti TaxID=2705254 RepID=UPI001BA7729E|nr:LysE family transporter [Catenulispora pinistramenti]MBS2534864.1 LysE family transporter [Catenulispora pinistramenti]
MWDEIWTSAGAGALAGLGVALPLGAVGALLLREGLVNGFRVAAASAAGIATVDTLYCTVATLAGAVVAPTVQRHRGVFLVLSGLLIVVIGVRQLRRGLMRQARAVSEVEQVSASAAYVRFVGLTAVNPTTLVYFVALSGALATRGGSWAGPAAFVAAAGVASLAWQLVLAAIGALFGRSVGAGATRTIGVVASVLVIALGIGVLANGLGSLARP